MALSSKYFVGSLQAITENGELLIASGSGSQIPSIAFSSENVILVVGAQKIVTDYQNGLKRLWEYCLPKEDERIKSAGGRGSSLNKILIVEKEGSPSRKIHIILVKESLGF